MKDSRLGESLWFIWNKEEGDIFYYPDSIVLYTKEHVDLEQEIVRRALASTLQREGVSHSLSVSFSMIDTSITIYGHVGKYQDSDQEVICTESGETYDGDVVSNIEAVTWVEVEYFD